MVAVLGLTGCASTRQELPPIKTVYHINDSTNAMAAMNNILHERQLEEYYCTLCYASFDFKRKLVTMANSGLPYPIRCTAEGCAQIDLPGVPLGSFAGTTYDEATYPLAPGDVFVICSDGLHGYLRDEEIPDITMLGPESAVRRFIDIDRQQFPAHADLRQQLTPPRGGGRQVEPGLGGIGRHGHSRW